MAKSPIPIPARPDAPTAFLEEVSLQDSLSAIADMQDARSAALSILRGALEDGLGDAQVRFEAGRLDGLETARLISAVHDVIMRAIWRFATDHVLPNANPSESERIALCAVGGYGRGEMAPFSDLDLLFVTTDKKTAPYVEQLTEYVLYMLWDLGFTVGHSVRTSDQAIRLAKEDQTILTAMLDLRYLCGDAVLATGLHTRIRRDLTKGSGRDYIAGKLAERDMRHAREGNSRYVIEPNIKDGKGGLRDLHVLYWIARFLDTDGVVNDPQDMAGYVAMDLFDENAAQRFARAADFLWRARHHLHWISGRATEALSFDRQVALCRVMGYASGPVEIAVERFMREYFTNAKEVGALTRIACARLEARRAVKISNLFPFLPGMRRNLKNPALKIETGRLTFRDPLTIKENPSVILELFETAGRRNLDIHPDALQAIDYRSNLIDADFRRDPANAAIFMRLLRTAKAPYATLKLMNEAGVLGRYLTEFGGIVARTQFNMHHAYTVDEHTLRLVSEADDLMDGRDPSAKLPMATEVAQGLKPEQRLTLMLACLLHDTGKGQGDQCIEGAQLSRRACRRLGMSKEVTDTVAWLVRSHLSMSETAQRRDISDPDTIAEFAELVGNEARLDLLYILTVADIRSVGPGVWNDWKGTLLRGLYVATRDYLQGAPELDRTARAATIAEQVEDKLPVKMAGRLGPLFDRLGPSYWLAFDMSDLLRHARFFGGLIETGQDMGVQIRVDRAHDATEVWCLGWDRLGLFADLSRAIASCGGSVAGARLHTGPLNDEGRARIMNVFYLQNADGKAFGADNERMRDMLVQRALKAMTEGTQGMFIADPRHSRRVEAIPVRSRVRFIEAPQDGSMIIEVEGRDRPGLLAALAVVLRDANIDVTSAHIEGIGSKAVDAFYVRSTDPLAFSEAARRQLKTALSDALRGPVKDAA